MPRKLTPRGSDPEPEIVAPASAEEADESPDDQDQDLPFFEWVAPRSFFEWAGAEPRLAYELEVDVEAVQRAVRTIALIDAMEAFYGQDLFWSAVFGTDADEPKKPRVDPTAAYARLPKGVVPSRI